MACYESTSGGLIQAALLATEGASKITTCGAVSYTSSRAVPVLGPAAQSLDELETVREQEIEVMKQDEELGPIMKEEGWLRQQRVPTVPHVQAFALINEREDS